MDLQEVLFKINIKTYSSVEQWSSQLIKEINDSKKLAVSDLETLVDISFNERNREVKEEAVKRLLVDSEAILASAK